MGAWTMSRAAMALMAFPVRLGEYREQATAPGWASKKRGGDFLALRSSVTIWPVIAFHKAETDQIMTLRRPEYLLIEDSKKK